MQILKYGCGDVYADVMSRDGPVHMHTMCGNSGIHMILLHRQFCDITRLNL